MPTQTPRARAARKRAVRRWQVYLILCRGNTIYTGIALDVAARYTRANPPLRLREPVDRRETGGGDQETAG